ncbi:MAG: adenosylmethionine decarboxylase [Dictyoglomus sp. NZ13-RE01]|nr:MAG: adenosylmethionine decarboxylase [Dictyoglomus sp. NZ13-RE01]
MLGPHLVLDLYGCPKELLEDVNYIYRVLDELPTMIGMHKIMPPYVIRYLPEEDPMDWGVSGVVIIAESHIAIHTWPDLNYVSIDIFSCKLFDIDKAKAIIEEKFKPEKIEWEILVRGREFPVHLLRRGRNGAG